MLENRAISTPIELKNKRKLMIYSQFLIAFCFSMFSAILSPYLKSVGFSNIMLGIIFSLTPLISILAAPIVGKMSDRVGRREVILFAVVFSMFGFYLYTLNPYFVFAGRVLHALGWVTTTVVFLSWFEDHSEDEKRGKETGIFMSLGTIGKMLGPFIAGIMADELFVLAPFYTAIILMGVLALIILKTKPKAHSNIQKTDFNLIENIKFFWSKRSLRGKAFLGFAVNATIPLMEIFLPLYIISKFGLSYGYIGIAMFFYFMPGVFQFFYGRIADKITSKKMIIYSVLLKAVALILLFYSKDFVVFVLCLTLAGLGGAMFSTSGWTYLSKIGEYNKREGEVIGSYLSFAKLGDFISTLASGFIVTWLGIPSLFIIYSIVLVLGVIVFVLHRPRSL